MKARSIFSPGVIIIGALLAALTLESPAGLAVHFTPMAGAGTAIPGGTGSFVAIPTDPCISFGNVAFGGEGSGGQFGIYLVPLPPPILPVADMNTAVPGGSGLFTSLPSGPAILESSVEFLGSGSGGQQGIYLSTDVANPQPPPIKLADLSTAIPDGSGNFIGFPAGPSVSSAAVAFIGDGPGGQQGVYFSPKPPPIIPSPPPIRLADTSTEIPNGFGNFTGFVPPNPTVPPNPITPIPPPISESVVAFFGTGEDGQQGIYLVDSAQPSPPPIVPVADVTTAIPESGGARNFSSFERLALENSDVAFVGRGIVVPDGSMDAIVQKGVYTAIGGTLAKVADPHTVIPGLDSLFTDFGAVAIDPGKVVFVGFGDGGLKGLYTNFGGSL